ncbi:hypothetical protein D3C73_811080 [compost metagenome]
MADGGGRGLPGQGRGIEHAEIGGDPLLEADEAHMGPLLTGVARGHQRHLLAGGHHRHQGIGLHHLLAQSGVKALHQAGVDDEIRGGGVGAVHQHEGLCGELGQGDPLAIPQGVFVRYHQHHGLPIDGLGLQRVDVEGVGEAGEADVYLLAGQRLLLALGRELGEGDVALGVALVALADHLAKAGPEDGADQPDADLVALHAPRLHHPVEAALQHIEQPLAFGLQQTSCGGQVHLTGVAIKQGHSQQGFQLLDVSAQRRFGDIEPQGGPAEVALARHFMEVAQHLEGDAIAPLAVREHGLSRLEG